MAGLHHDVAQSLPESQIEAVQSVSPFKVTEPRRVRQVLVSDTDPVIPPKAKTICGCHQIVLYYEKLNNEEGGWFLAGWVVESLARALLEHPLLAGRLQRKEHGDMGLEIVSNDSGIRLLEARFPMNLAEFLALSERQHLEAELVFWKEIDEQSPEFSPLFYVQVTNFECGGYSIGISCSLLLADVLIVENFLKKWAEIHNNMLLLHQNEETKSKTPIFYHPRLKRSEYPPDDVISRTPSKNGAHSMVFKITAANVNFNKELLRELAMLCVEEAEQKQSKKMGSEFSVFVKESSEVIKVEGCSKSGYNMEVLGMKNQITCTTWNDFGVYEVAFHEGNTPVLVSRWIGSVADGLGHVIAIPYPKENISAAIIVSIPIEKEL